MFLKKNRKGKMVVVKRAIRKMRKVQIMPGEELVQPSGLLPLFKVNSKKYGLIRFAHNFNSAVHSSTKVDNTIRYLSLYDNKYLRYFQGHSQQVTALSMSPVDDMFLSASLDKTIRLWYLRTNSCQGLMEVADRNNLRSRGPNFRRWNQ